MKGLTAFLLSSSGVSALDGGKIADLLDFFKANQQKYQINVEQYCKFGDLPLMELTEYSCQDVIESSLTDGKTCAYACKHDASITGNIECLCDNDDTVVSDAANCKWKFPAYSSVCGLNRMAAVDTKLDALQAGHDEVSVDITGLNSMIDQTSNNILEINEDIADNAAAIQTQHDAAILAVDQAAADALAARALLQTDLSTSIGDLEASDVNMMSIITANGDTLGDIVTLTDGHSDTIQTHTQDITAAQQDIADHSVDIAALDAELDSETGNLLTALNNQILQQETDHSALQTEINNNLQHTTDMDTELNTAILAVKDDLAAEILEGAVRDSQIDAHDTEFANVKSDIDSNTDLIELTQEELNHKFLFLTNYTDNAVEARGLLIDAEVQNLAADLTASNDANTATDTAIMTALNNTQAALDAEEARGDTQDAWLTNIDTNIETLNTDVATNVDSINTVQANLDHEVEVIDLNLNITKNELQSNMDANQAAADLADQALAHDIEITNLNLNNTQTDLDEEEAAGIVRDGRLDLIEADATTLFGNVDDINDELDETMELMKANDTRMQDEMDANLQSLTDLNNALNASMRAADSALTDTDNDLSAWIQSTNDLLDEEEARGDVRDATLADHETRITDAEADLVDKQTQIDDLEDKLDDEVHDLQHLINNTDHAIRADMIGIRDTLMDADDDLADADTAINARIDDTDAALAVETTRNDDQDVTLQSHTDTLDAHAVEITDLEAEIAAVAGNLDTGVTGVEDELADTTVFLNDEINVLHQAMLDKDAELQAAIDAVDDDLTTTQGDLDTEVSNGEIRDATLEDHNVRLTLLRSDTDQNTAALAAIDEQLIIEINNVTTVINENADSGNDALDELDRRLTAADHDLQMEDVKIRGEMATQKLLLEKNFENDLDFVDGAIRNHFTNEVYQLDSKVTNSINSLSMKQQKDINDVHAALDFFWGVYRPSKLILFEGVFQPEIGHLVTILPALYRIWHMEVDIMPTGKNHYSWVNLLHFTASGDNYGRAGDRMPLISFYPGENKLHIACYINNEVSYAYDNDYILPMHRWTKLEVGQTYVQGQFVYYVKLNGKQVYSVINRYPRDFSNMMVYASDPWSEKPNAKLRNLFLTTSWAPNVIPVLTPLGPWRSEGEEGAVRSMEVDGIDSTGAPSEETSE